MDFKLHLVEHVARCLEDDPLGAKLARQCHAGSS